MNHEDDIQVRQNVFQPLETKDPIEKFEEQYIVGTEINIDDYSSNSP